MAANYDLRLSDNDLVIKNGDFVIGESDSQHIEDSINAYAGWWKEHPQDGVGIFSYLNSSGRVQELARKIKLELQSDGYTVERPIITINNGELNINPNAVKL